LEHKSVAFDVYKAVGGTEKLRTKLMRISMMIFIKNVGTVTVRILKHDKNLWRWKTLKSVLKFLFSKQGLVRMHLPGYRAYFQEGFHPWDEDSRQILNRWKTVLSGNV